MPNLAADLRAAIKEQAIPVLTAAASSRGFVEIARRSWRNPHAPKAVAFVLARAGRRDDALAVIEEYLPNLNLAVKGERDIDEISKHLRKLLLEDPIAADKQLQEWEDYTIQKLGLESFR